MSLMQIHSFSEYHGTTEQYNGKIAKKSYANFIIRHYGSATTVAFDGCEEESPIKDGMHQNIRYNICKQLSASLLRQISQVRKKIHKQTETDPDDKW